MLKPYHVRHRGASENVSLEFFCWADDAAHAEEQLLNAYPGDTLIEAITELECPEGGDVTDRCEGCCYSGDYVFDMGQCVLRKRKTRHYTPTLMVNNLEVIVAESSEIRLSIPDDEGFLSIVITSEGVILDRYLTDGEHDGTSCESFDEIIERLTS